MTRSIRYPLAWWLTILKTLALLGFVWLLWNWLSRPDPWAYFDGLGRLSETVEQKKSPDEKDILHKVLYDNQGRVSKQYAPHQSGARAQARRRPRSTASASATR